MNNLYLVNPRASCGLKLYTCPPCATHTIVIPPASRCSDPLGAATAASWRLWHGCVCTACHAPHLATRWHVHGAMPEPPWRLTITPGHFWHVHLPYDGLEAPQPWPQPPGTVPRRSQSMTTHGQHPCSRGHNLLLTTNRHACEVPPERGLTVDIKITLQCPTWGPGRWDSRG